MLATLAIGWPRPLSYLEQKCPEWLLQLPELLGDSPVALGTLSGVMLLVALRAWRRRTG